MWNRRAAGVTLVELVVAIVIVAVALAGMVAVFARGDRASVDPVVSQQMAMIAESMMEEILLKPYGNAAAAPGVPRTAYTQVGNYDKYQSTGVFDIEGNAVPGLAQYKVYVEVVDAGLAQVAALESVKITVRIKHDDAASFVLTGWRTKP